MLISFDDLPKIVNPSQNPETLRTMALGAQKFLSEMDWCARIRQAYFECGVADILVLCYFVVEETTGTDDDVWVIWGDLPAMYMTTDEVASGMEALRRYVFRLEVWMDLARRGDPRNILRKPDGSGFMPPTAANIAWVATRKKMLEEQIVPWLADWSPGEE